MLSHYLYDDVPHLMQLSFQLLQQYQHNAVHKAHQHILDVLEVARRLQRKVQPSQILLAIHEGQHHDAGHHLLAAYEDVCSRLHATLQGEAQAHGIIFVRQVE